MTSRLLVACAVIGIAASTVLPFIVPSSHTAPAPAAVTALTHLDPVQRYQLPGAAPTTSPRREVVKVTASGSPGGAKSAQPTPLSPIQQSASATSRRAPPASRSYARPALTWSDLGVWAVTKYCWTGNRTASGVWPTNGQAATLDRTIPFGTVLRVVGDLDNGRHIDQTFTITDRIGHGSQLDLFAGAQADDPTCEPGVDRTWGLQHLRVQEQR